METATIETTTKTIRNIPGLNVDETPRAMINRIKPITIALRDQLEEYKNSHNLSLKQLARELGSSETMVSKYLAAKFEGNVEAFEGSVRDLLKSIALRANLLTGEVATFPTLVTNQIEKFLELCRRSSFVGLVFGEAGIGKTRALELYASKNKLTIHITANRCGGCNATGVQSSIWQQIDTSGYTMKKFGSRGAFIIHKLRGTGRLISVDNAHRLTKKALEWLFDFQDATGCPIALVGNPEVLDHIKANDQMFSRIGLKLEASLKKTTSKVALEILNRVWPQASEELAEAATQVANEHGHLRALFHQLRVAMEFHQSGISRTPLEAFRAAHSQLVRNYKLAA